MNVQGNRCLTWQSRSEVTEASQLHMATHDTPAEPRKEPGGCLQFFQFPGHLYFTLAVEALMCQLLAGFEALGELTALEELNVAFTAASQGSMLSWTRMTRLRRLNMDSCPVNAKCATCAPVIRSGVCAAACTRAMSRFQGLGQCLPSSSFSTWLDHAAGAVYQSQEQHPTLHALLLFKL